MVPQQLDVTTDMKRRHGRGKILHDLTGDAVSITRGLREGDSVLETGDAVVSPKAGVLIGELIGRKTQRHPELHLVEMAGLQRKLEAARHHADDGVRFAVKNDRAAEDVGIAVISVKPQTVTDDRERLMGVFFLRGEDAAEDWLNAEREKHAGSEAGGVDFLRLGTTGELIAGGDVAAQRGKGLGRARICCDLTGSDGNAAAASQAISQQNKPIGILKWKGPEQDAFH